MVNSGRDRAMMPPPRSRPRQPVKYNVNNSTNNQYRNSRRMMPPPHPLRSFGSPVRNFGGSILPPPPLLLRTRSPNIMNPLSPRSNQSLPTTLIDLPVSNHGRMRKEQRRIHSHTLKRVKKYGKKLRQGGGRSRYIHNGVEAVVEDATGKIITCFHSATPLTCMPVSQNEHLEHKAAVKILSKSNTSQTSLTVFIIDASGSMRNSDVRGSRTRLKAVFRALAEDFVKSEINNGTKTKTDAISVVLMTRSLDEEVRVIFDNEPISWILYNKLVRVHNEDMVIPGGHGCYLPALEKAEEILMKNSSASCVLGLTILSDGRPSDHKFQSNKAIERIHERIENISSKIGRRLIFSTVGIGSDKEFKLLKDLCKSANDYGAISEFSLPSRTTSGLGEAFSSIASSITASQVEMTDFGSKKQKTVRQVARERRSLIPMLTEVVDPKEFLIYQRSKVIKKVFDPKVEGKFKDVPLKADGVALRKKAFDEGAERIVHQFFEIMNNYSTVGKPLVAKESRFVEEHSTSDGAAKEDYVKRFCSIHYEAQRMAKAFNQKLKELKALDPSTARISFLDCSVYYLEDEDEDKLVLVEERLNQKFQKWNNNGGKILNKGMNQECFVINEDDESSWNDDFDPENDVKVFLSHEDVAQAFSHFTYYHSLEKILVVDLQGVFDRKNNILRLTDPSIHSVNKKYGRTDFGQGGIQKFLDTHECNYLCKHINSGFRRGRTNNENSHVCITIDE